MRCSFLQRGKTAAAIAIGASAIALAASLPAAAATRHPARPARPAAAAWTGAVVLVNCQHKGLVLPRSFILACADGDDFLTGMHWVSWRDGGLRQRRRGGQELRAELLGEPFPPLPGAHHAVAR